MKHPVSGCSPAETPPPAASVKGKLTRAQVAKRLCVSLSKVRTMEGKSLHPSVIDGVHYFERAEIDAVACAGLGSAGTRGRLDEGQIAARVFRMIDGGKELREIVEELEVSPQLVRDLYHEWKTDFDEGEQEQRRAAEARTEQREARHLEREAERQARDLERMLRELQKK